MKKIIMAVAALGSMALSAPVMANDFQGFRAEVTAGVDDVTSGPDLTDVTYGVGFGYDHQFGRVVAGVEASVDNVFDRRDLGVAARLGYAVTDSVLVYGKVGYQNWEVIPNTKLDGLRLGGGLEVNVAGPFYVKGEYRWTDFQAGVGRHAGLVGAGIRF